MFFVLPTVKDINVLLGIKMLSLKDVKMEVESYCHIMLTFYQL